MKRMYQNKYYIYYKSINYTPVGYIVLLPEANYMGIPILQCNGGLLSKVDFPELYAVIGDTYSLRCNVPRQSWINTLTWRFFRRYVLIDRIIINPEFFNLPLLNGAKC